MEVYKRILLNNFIEKTDEKIFPHFAQSGAELKYLLPTYNSISLMFILITLFKISKIKKWFGY